MTDHRDHLKNATSGALQGLIASPAVARGFSALLDKDIAQQINPDFDAEAYNFWSGFLANVADTLRDGLRRVGRAVAFKSSSQRLQCSTPFLSGPSSYY